MLLNEADSLPAADHHGTEIACTGGFNDLANGIAFGTYEAVGDFIRSLEEECH